MSVSADMFWILAIIKKYGFIEQIAARDKAIYINFKVAVGISWCHIFDSDSEVSDSAI